MHVLGSLRPGLKESSDIHPIGLNGTVRPMGGSQDFVHFLLSCLLVNSMWNKSICSFVR